ncbi:MAG: hypothetical protein WC369_09530, partial [Dehalococcoidales bacterium]
MTAKGSSKALSDFWRRRRSLKPDAELANVLRAARGYTGFFGTNFRVDWGDKNVIEPDGVTVLLDYAPLQNKPVPFCGRDIDQVMGTAIYECGRLKWSYPERKLKEYYRKRCRLPQDTKLPAYSPDEFDEIKTVGRIVEDYGVERKINGLYPTLGSYLRQAREMAVKDKLPTGLLHDLTTSQPAFDSLVTMWGIFMLTGKPVPKSISPAARKTLDQLIEMTKPSVNLEEEERLALTYQIWEFLKGYPRSSQKKPGHQQDGDNQQDARTESEKRRESEGGREDDKNEDGSTGRGRNSAKNQPEPLSHHQLRDCYLINLAEKQSLPPRLKES